MGVQVNRRGSKLPLHLHPGDWAFQLVGRVVYIASQGTGRKYEEANLLWGTRCRLHCAPSGVFLLQADSY